jgi:hypothetical protein
MKTRMCCLSLIMMMALMSAGAPAQTTVDQRLIVTQNDAVNGGSYTIAVQVKATNLTGNNTLGSATIDVQYDPARLTYSTNTFPDAPSGISLANGYSKFVNEVGSTIRVAATPFAVNGTSVRGTDLTASYVTWATITFTIVNSTLSTTISINPATNQIGLFTQEGGGGNGNIVDQTLSTPIGINDTSLPVELVNFTVTAERLGARLDWKTATESNNAGFDIERADAALGLQSRKWMDIGFVAGAGTTSAEHTYTFIAENVSSGKSVYRLKQVDRDGGVKYSQEVEAAAIIPSAFALLQNYPNPFNPSTQIGYTLPEDSRVSIIAYDVVGRAAAVLVDEAKPAGTYTLSFDAGKLSSGVYVYRMTARSGTTVFTETKRFVLMR